MNYNKMKQVAIKLLKSFGSSNPCTLIKRIGNETKQYRGIGVKLDYNSEAVGSNDNMIKAGDAKLICYFDVPPTEMTDIVVFGNDSFNIINAGSLNPTGLLDVLFILQVRRK